MKTVLAALIAALIGVVGSALPSAAQYSYSGSAGGLRTPPPQAKDKTATPAQRSPNAPNAGLTGQTNRTGAAAQRTEGPPKPPSRNAVPLNVVLGQARPVPGAR